MSETLPAALRRSVVQRAQGRCEYCLIHEDHTLLAHHVDHVIARKHGGASTLDNLALACADCNWAKGADLAAFDPLTGQLVTLFNPRQQNWFEHFRLDGAVIVPLTPTARATADLLRFNEQQRVEERLALQKLGLYP